MEKTYLITGHFDFITPDVIGELKRAAEKGPLTVGVWTDALFERMKGHAPNCPEEERLYMVRAIRWVSEAHLIDYISKSQE